MIEPSLDTWTSAFFAVSLFGLFFAVIMLQNGRQAIRKNWPIATIILGYSVVLFQYSLYWTGYIRTFPFLNFTLGAWFLSFGPLLYIYVVEFNEPQKRKFLHFIPALICLVLSFIFYLSYFNFSVMSSVSILETMIRWVNNPWLSVVSMLIYLILSMRSLRRSWNKFENFQLKQLFQKWMRVLFISFFVFILAYASYFVLVQFPFFNVSWDYGIAVGMTVSIYSIGVFVYLEPSIFNGDIQWMQPQIPASSFSDQSSLEFYQSIVALIKDQELFLDGNLRLAHISDKLGLSIQDTSRIVNQFSGKNFNQFINTFRIEKAKSLLTERPNLHVKEVCYASGFNSKVSFFSAFKETTGLTPTQYRLSAPASRERSSVL